MTYSKLYFSGNTDIQRLLHNIKVDTPRPRRCGRTYSTLLYMVGQVFWGPHNKTFLFIGENKAMCDTVRYDFMEIVEGKGVPVTNSNKITIQSTGQKFIFSPVHAWEIVTKGYSLEKTFLDIVNPFNMSNLALLKVVSKDIHFG